MADDDLNYGETLEVLRSWLGSPVHIQMRSSMGAADVLDVWGVLNEAKTIEEVGVMFALGDTGLFILHFDTFERGWLGEGQLYAHMKGGALLRCLLDVHQEGRGW